jgi:superfamily II DNA or RNA helicase
MATGTGKTLTACVAIGFLSRSLATNRKSVLVVIVCPYIHVVDQWQKALEAQNQTSLAAYESRNLWEKRFKEITQDLALVPGKTAYIVTTIATFKSKFFQDRYSTLRTVESIFVADEVHHFGSKTLSKVLPPKAKYRLGLSATPDRHLDKRGTARIFDYFGPAVYKLDLKAAIDMGVLCTYEYKPRICHLSLEETVFYAEISELIGHLLKGREFYELSKVEEEKMGKLLRQRSAVLGTSMDKQAKFLNDFRSQAHKKHQLVYCSQGSSPVYDNMGRHIEYVGSKLTSLGMRFATYEAATPRLERLEILKDFSRGSLDVVLSMKCLDEAVDIPEAQTSYFLASGTNPREFIQRRGRVLRQHPGKTHAVIWDYIALPSKDANREFPDSEKLILKRELDRAYELADAASNSEEAKHVLDGIIIEL